MKKLIKIITAFLCCLLAVNLFTACEIDDPVDASVEKAVVGSWYADLTGKTYAMWNLGTAWSVVTIHADGTGTTDVYYTIEGEPIAREHQAFTCTAREGCLTMHLEDGDRDYAYMVSGEKWEIDREGISISYEKADAEKMAHFESWGRQDLETVPAPARYTVFVYGNSGGDMDKAIEQGFWNRIQPLLEDGSNVRVVCLYKYGQDTNGTMTEDGDVVWFELNSETDLSNLRGKGLNFRGMNTEAIALRLYNPGTLRIFMELSSLLCPAEEYVLAIWGHGEGFDPTIDIPGKFEDQPVMTRGVLGDEWNEYEELDMYELAQAIKATGRAPLKAIFFHSCLMGNIETLTELRDVTEYIACSSHILISNGTLMCGLICSLIGTENVEEAFDCLLSVFGPDWQRGYESFGMNGDFKILRTKGLDCVLDASRRLAARLVELYPEYPKSIGRATCRVYRYKLYDDDPSYAYVTPFFDLADYAHKLAEETQDTGFMSIAEDMDNAFADAILQSADVNVSKQNLPHYSLSVCLYSQMYYYYDFRGTDNHSYKANIGEGYEQCTFHKLTGWGNFLRINQQLPLFNPYSGGGGLLNEEDTSG